MQVAHDKDEGPRMIQLSFVYNTPADTLWSSVSFSLIIFCLWNYIEASNKFYEHLIPTTSSTQRIHSTPEFSKTLAFRVLLYASRLLIHCLRQHHHNKQQPIPTKDIQRYGQRPFAELMNSHIHWCSHYTHSPQKSFKDPKLSTPKQQCRKTSPKCKLSPFPSRNISCAPLTLEISTSPSTLTQQNLAKVPRGYSSQQAYLNKDQNFERVPLGLPTSRPTGGQMNDEWEKQWKDASQGSRR